MTEQYREFISKPEISFWMPIIVSIVTITMSWLNLSTRIDLVSQKVDLILAQQQTSITVVQDRIKDLELSQSSDYNKMQAQWGELSQRVTRLER